MANHYHHTQGMQWPTSAHAERPQLSVQTTSPRHLPPYHEENPQSLFAPSSWRPVNQSRRPHSDTFSHLSAQTKNELAGRTGLSFSIQPPQPYEIDLGGRVTQLPQSPLLSPSRAAARYTPVSATFPTISVPSPSQQAETKIVVSIQGREDDDTDKRNAFFYWKEYHPSPLARKTPFGRHSSIATPRDELIDAVSGLNLGGPVKGLGKLARPVMHKYYHTEQALAEFMHKSDRVLLRPSYTGAEMANQRELERIETELFDTSKYMNGNGNNLTVVTWSDDSPWGAITLFEVDTPLPNTPRRSDSLLNRRKRFGLASLDLRENGKGPRAVKPVAAMELVPQQVLTNIRMDTAIKKLICVHQNGRFKWVVPQGSASPPCYARLQDPDEEDEEESIPSPPKGISTTTAAMEADEEAILGYRRRKTRSRHLSADNPGYSSKEIDADGVVATIPQFLALLHANHSSLIEVASSSAITSSYIPTDAGEFKAVNLDEFPKGKKHTGRAIHVVVLLPARADWADEKIFWTDEVGSLRELRQGRFRGLIERPRRRRRPLGMEREPGWESPPLSARSTAW
ncbi:hypothetical protein QBC35DRAFT_381504 [Podospora australis]|uniref:Uncharacterized protein n=1 Tax=Podospora australis TaxID=1536484 RepID=A0AAN7AJF4_9PEZI|nr:hypothetical protein QBC35DRAFT_381504 [Podospora australis]